MWYCIHWVDINKQYILINMIVSIILLIIVSSFKYKLNEEIDINDRMNWMVVSILCVGMVNEIFTPTGIFFKYVLLDTFSYNLIFLVCSVIVEHNRIQ